VAQPQQPQAVTEYFIISLQLRCVHLTFLRSANPPPSRLPCVQLCPEGHFCREFSIYPRPCPISSHCPAGSEIPQLSFGGIAIAVMMLSLVMPVLLYVQVRGFCWVPARILVVGSCAAPLAITPVQHHLNAPLVVSRSIRFGVSQYRKMVSMSRNNLRVARLLQRQENCSVFVNDVLCVKEQEMVRSSASRPVDNTQHTMFSRL
jgi:hypothetical protein